MDIEKEFKKGKKAIWSKYEKKEGLRLTQEIKDAIENLAGCSPDEETYLQDLESSISDHIRIISKTMQDGQLNSTAKGEPKRRYQKCFERRFYLVDFVVTWGQNMGTHRIDWKRTVTEWNKAHPSDTMSLPVLKAEYYRALRERPLLQQYFVTYAGKMAASYWRFYSKFYYKYDNDIPKAKKIKENYLKFFELVMRESNTFDEVLSQSKFFKRSFYFLYSLLDGIQETRRLLERESTAKGGTT